MPELGDAPLLETRGLSKSYHDRGGRSLKALTDVNLTLASGEVLAIVGESGCGKSTLGRVIVGLEPDAEGSILYKGWEMRGSSAARIRAFRSEVQMIFQDPYASLNPRLTALSAVREPLDNYARGSREERTRRAEDLMSRVGLGPQFRYKYPHQMSGGQRQRLGIARALALEPSIVIADEPVSALDVSIQAQVLNLITELQHEMALSILFISHDISVVDYVSDRVAVMYLGRVVEAGRTAQVLGSPAHPYTQALLASVPIENPSERRKRTLIKGEMPSPFNPPSGCAFRTRCPLAHDRCAVAPPTLAEVSETQSVACYARQTAQKDQETDPARVAQEGAGKVA